MRGRRLIVIFASLVIGFGALVSACGSDMGPAAGPAPPPPELAGGDAVAGKDIFVDRACGSCHTLADAGTSGGIGLDLDQSQPSLERAVNVITTGSGSMPAFGDDGTLTQQQILDVASYIVSVTR
ncbi:MAG: cytochrome c [Actinomycetia bacterium]|nr:cytochrome c [Actinomycetes bacterium]